MGHCQTNPQAWAEAAGLLDRETRRPSKTETTMFSDTPGSQPSEYSFWDHPGAWPHDPPGYAFLARACHEVGRAMFGSKWADSWGEPDEPPHECGQASWEDYERACDEFQNAFVAMRAAVVQEIATQCEIGTLVAAVRPKPGGQMIALVQHMWNFERVEPRFHRCDMSLDDPFETGGGSPRPYWIFIERVSLDRFLVQQHQRTSVPNSTAASIDTALHPNGFKQPRKHKLILAMQMLREVYPNGLPAGETEILFLRKVRGHMRNSGKPDLSDSTLKRAKKRLAESTRA